MFTPEELQESAAAYLSGRMAFRDFDEWFEDHSFGAHTVASLKDVFEKIEGAFARYHFESQNEAAFREELATAFRPFVVLPRANATPIEIVYGRKTLRRATSASDWVEVPSPVHQMQSPNRFRVASAVALKAT